jgi:hypothetical protein
MEILLGALLAVAVVALLLVALKALSSRLALELARKEDVERQHAIAQLQGRVATLAQYQTVVDASEAARILTANAEQAAQNVIAHGHALANQMRQEAEARAGGIVATAQQSREQAEREAAAIKATIESQRAAATESSRRLQEQAAKDAAATVAAAETRAKEIAGEAMEAVKHAKELRETVVALKNVIEGYGDRYIAPSFGHLDALADEFGFAEAGVQLKAARQRVRDMVKQGAAATCDYVEENRRETAVRFVLLAFNGAVDTVLADVRDDNAGTLERKIRDQFQLVNHNGAAFRDARITDAYLAARLDELRWAVTAQQLKEKAREEQRALRERMRDDEKAAKEIERALKEAMKDQEAMQKAEEKMRLKFEQASDDQKAKYEVQLRELQAKMLELEAKTKRALSMAQQTKAGHVYIISNIGSFGEDVYKIGQTRRLEPTDRVRELGDASVPFEFDIHAMIQCDDAPGMERALHKRFLTNQVNKVNPRKEFFRAKLADLRAEAERHGCQAQWTMAAEARQYKETLAIEKAIAEKRIDEGQWEASQLKQKDAAAVEDLVLGRESA